MHKKNIRLLSTGFISAEITGELNDPTVALDIVPFTSIRAINDITIQRIIGSVAEEKTTVIFTSINAVRAVISKLANPPAWKIFCTNGPTLRAIVAFFGKESVTASAENAQGLADLIITEKIPAAVFFCGTKRLDTLPDMLGESGYGRY